MMKKGKLAVLVCAVLAVMLFACACANNVGILAPRTADEETKEAVFRAAGMNVVAAETAEAAAFTYKWQEPVNGLHVWADLYKDGQYVAAPVDLNLNGLEDSTGQIVLILDEVVGASEDITLFVSNGTGSNAQVFAKTATLEIGEAMSPFSQTSIEDTQVTELGQQNVLLVVHDGPGLDTEMTNDVNQAAQLIEASTYTLVLNAQFS